MNVPSLFQSLSDKIESGANVKSVFGEPVSVAGKTIIPVAKVAFGFGGGIGIHEPEQIEDGQQKPESSAGGGGGGGVAMPVGVIEISDSDTRFIPIGIEKKLGATLFLGAAAGFILGKLSRRRK